MTTTKKKKKGVSREIRIAKPSFKVYETVERLAERENRTIAGQADYMLLQFIEKNKL